jgi:hypothetical protein
LETTLNRLTQFNTVIKPLHKAGFSLIPIASDSKQPVMLEKYVYTAFAKVDPNEDLYLSENGNLFVKRRKHFGWRRYQKRQITLQTLKKYWMQGCQIALVTGFNNTVVLDVDLKHGPEVESLFWKWFAEHEDILNQTAIQRTPSGGFHLFFKTDKPLKKSKLYIDDVCIGDFQAEGAYVLIAPSTYSIEPFTTYFSTMSASLPNTEMLCHSVSVTFSPALFLYVSLVAKEKFATLFPFSNVLTCGSLPTLPTKITLLIIL